MWRGETNFRDNLFHLSASLQKFNRFVNTFDELCDAALNWEDEETFLNKLFFHSQRFRGHYLMFLIAAYPSDYEKPGQLPVSEVLMGRSRLGLMDIHNFFNPYVFEVRDSASYYTTLIGSHRSRFE